MAVLGTAIPTRHWSSGRPPESHFVFSRQAVQEIVQATGNVDNLAGEFWVGEAHCDDDLVLHCHRRLMKLKADSIDAVEDEEARSGILARLYAGRALHTLQDFYSHSNWVMTPGLGNTSPFTALGVPGADAQVRALLPASNLATCRSDGVTVAFDGEFKITTGHFKAEVWSFLTDTVISPGRCNHGFGPTNIKGIHKDEPSRPFHDQARHVAVLATQAYVTQILDALDDGGKRAFMGIGGTLGFVIDDTGSMGSEIAGVISRRRATHHERRGASRGPSPGSVHSGDLLRHDGPNCCRDG